MKYQAMLEKEKQELMSSLQELNRFVSENNSDLRDPLDIASANEERSRASSEITRKKLRLSKLNLSLSNIEDYGYCTECAEEINPKRLAFDLTVTTCVDCQSLLDKKVVRH